MNDEVDSLELRSAQQVAERALALIAVTARVHKNEAKQTFAKLSNFDLESLLTPSERAFFFSVNPSEQQLVNFSWRAEALASLIWALNGLQDFPPLNEQVAVGKLAMVDKALDDPRRFVSEARLRTVTELEAMEEDLYHHHWRVRDAQLFNKPMPSELNPSVVYERRYAMSWLIGWGEDWDNVPTDT
jgi:Domain of unknown function (DUF4272)